MMTFNGFVQNYILKIKATSNKKIKQILDSIGLDKFGNFLRDGSFSSDIRLVSLHPSKRTNWVPYINQNCFDSYGCVCRKKLFKFILGPNGYCLYSEYQIQKNDSFCASYCL